VDHVVEHLLMLHILYTVYSFDPHSHLGAFFSPQKPRSLPSFFLDIPQDQPYRKGYIVCILETNPLYKSITKHQPPFWSRPAEVKEIDSRGFISNTQSELLEYLVSNNTCEIDDRHSRYVLLLTRFFEPLQPRVSVRSLHEKKKRRKDSCKIYLQYSLPNLG
jgi:hypothetical protein